MIKVFLPFVAVFLIAAIHDNARVRSVPEEYPTIQSAIDAAVNGDTVLVSPGTYEESIDFLGKEILVTSLRGPEGTVIDGTLNPDSSVVTFRSGETRESILDGFTITGGTGNYGPFSTNCGGGVFICDSSPTIQNNIIQENGLPEYYTMGGGIYICTEYQSTKAKIIGNLVQNNTAINIGGGIFSWYTEASIIANIIRNNISWDIEGVHQPGYGGGIYSCLSKNFIYGNLIEGNEAGNYSLWSTGGGIDLTWSKDTFIGNIIRNNSASQGGGMYVHNEADDVTELYNNIFTNNIAKGDGNNGGRGGGIQLFQGLAILRNNVICQNTAEDGWQDGFGGGISFYSGGNSLIENNIVAYQKNGGGIYLCGSSHELSYNDVYGNIGGDYLGGSVPHETDISVPPRFISLELEDYRLLPISPCIDAGNPEILDPDSTRSDIGAFHFDQSGPLVLYITPDKKEYSKGETAKLRFTLVNISEELQTGAARVGVVTAREDSVIIGERDIEIEPLRMERLQFSFPIPQKTPQGVYIFFGEVGDAKDRFLFSIF